MISEHSLARAQSRAAEIEARGLSTGVTVVSVRGVTGGRESRPIEYGGHAVRYVRTETGLTELCLFTESEFRDATDAFYIVDGAPYYVTHWHPDATYVGLAPITRIKRPDGLMVDFGLRPRRAYVLWTSEISEVTK